MEGSVTFTGKGFQKLRQALDPMIRERMRECGELTARFAKDTTSYKHRTGTNRRSTTVEFLTNGKPNGAITEGEFDVAENSRHLLISHGIEETFLLYTQSGYGGYLETGTSKRQAHPAIKPGFDRAVAFLMRDLEGAADKVKP